MPSFPFAGVCTEKPMGREGRDMSLSIFFCLFWWFVTLIKSVAR